jgi:hypothetical protein
MKLSHPLNVSRHSDKLSPHILLGTTADLSRIHNCHLQNVKDKEMLGGVWLDLASDLGIRLGGLPRSAPSVNPCQPGPLTRALLHASGSNKHKYSTLYSDRSWLSTCCSNIEYPRACLDRKDGAVFIHVKPHDYKTRAEANNNPAFAS